MDRHHPTNFRARDDLPKSSYQPGTVSVNLNDVLPDLISKRLQGAFIEFGKKVNGIPYANITDVFLGTSTTAHILGGAVMGEDISKGVIDKNNQVFGYKNMFVCDGAMISANPGVNPSLSITAISEHAMSKIPTKTNNQI